MNHRVVWVALGLATLPLLSGCRAREGEEGRAAVQTGSNGETPAESRAGVMIDSATARRIGLRTEALRPTGRGAELALVGELVADPAGSTTLRSPVAGRLSAASAPWPGYGDSLAAGVEIAQVADARPLTVPRSGIVVRVLAQPGELVQAGQELMEIADYGHPLARIAWRDDAPNPPNRSLEIAPVGRPERRESGHLVGPAPEADPLTRRAAWLYRLEKAWPGARPGNAVTAFVPDPRGTRGALLVPLEAVVQWESLAWVFVERGRGRFVRTRISTDQPVPGGWLVRGDLTAGDSVVVRGAEELLSEEFRARITVGEEVGE